MDTRPGASGNTGPNRERARRRLYAAINRSITWTTGRVPLPFDPIRDFAPVSMVADGIPLVLVVAGNSQLRSVQDFITLAKARKGQLNFATAGRGTSSHLVALMLKQLTGAEVNQVPYKGSSQSISALIAGEITASIPYLSVVLPLTGRRLRACVTAFSARRAARTAPFWNQLPGW